MRARDDLSREARKVYTALIQYRRGLHAAADSVLWVAAIALAVWFRYDGHVPPETWRGLLTIIPLVAAAQLVVGTYQGIYLGRWSFGSFEEVAALIKTVAATTFVFWALDWGPRLVPISTPFMAAFIAVVAMAGLRYAWRLTVERRIRPAEDRAHRLIVFGAGEAATQIVTGLLRNVDSAYLPVAMLDDDPRKANLRIRHVPVRGTRHEMAAVAKSHSASVLLIAIPSADAVLIRDLSALAAEADLEVRVLPPVHELFGGEVGESDIRPVSEADLLGRREIQTDLGAIAGYLTGRRVLITGAGGSIGSELCRQLHTFGPERLVMLDRDESALHALQLSIDGRGQLDSRNLVVADIRDAERMLDVFEEHRPHVVFHAAALKHVPLLEMYPAEGFKTNVLGTLNVISAAAQVGVERFVNVSTDKAANPCNTLGWSKRLTERLTAHAHAVHDGTFLSVRFGNVLGSRGSVLTAFRAQIEAGGPVTVTHPEVTRFFMTIEEACQLVIQAGAISKGGTVSVLDMGLPVRIAEVAQRLIDGADRRVEIVYTGLRLGEKMHEELFGMDESIRPTEHPLITEVEVPPISGDEVAWIDPRDVTALDLVDPHLPQLFTFSD